jgi:hypothetical protein
MSSFLATAVLALAVVTAPPESPQWETSYGKALESTRSEGQPLLVVLDKPGSADARLAPELMSPGEQGAKQLELLRSYELCHVDVSTEYGQKVADAFKAKTFPHVAVIDKTGSVIIYSKSGQTSSDEWARILSAYKSGDRSMAVSRVSYKPAGNGSMFQQPTSGYIMGPANCPSCQRRSF